MYRYPRLNSLFRLDLAEGFTDVTADIRNPVLALPRQAAYPAAEQQDRHHHQRNTDQQQSGQLGRQKKQIDDAADAG